MFVREGRKSWLINASQVVKIYLKKVNWLTWSLFVMSHQSFLPWNFHQLSYWHKISTYGGISMQCRHIYGVRVLNNLLLPSSWPKKKQYLQYPKETSQLRIYHFVFQSICFPISPGLKIGLTNNGMRITLKTEQLLWLLLEPNKGLPRYMKPGGKLAERNMLAVASHFIVHGGKQGAAQVFSLSTPYCNNIVIEKRKWKKQIEINLFIIADSIYRKLTSI